MKKTLSTSEAASMLAENKDNGFSYSGAYALIDYCEDQERDLGEEMEFDAVALRCDFSEFETALEAAKEYGFEPEIDEGTEETEDAKDELEEQALEFLQDKTTVIEFDGGLIVQAF